MSISTPLLYGVLFHDIVSHYIEYHSHGSKLTEEIIYPYIEHKCKTMITESKNLIIENQEEMVSDFILSMKEAFRLISNQTHYDGIIEKELPRYFWIQGVDCPIKYIPDAVYKNGILDFKFTKNKKDQFFADNDIGLTMYALALQIYDNLYIDNYIVSISKVRKSLRSDHQLIKTSRSIEQINDFKQTISFVYNSIVKENFTIYQKPPYCTEKFCSYWTICNEKDQYN
jgi:hypothetical protein